MKQLLLNNPHMQALLAFYNLFLIVAVEEGNVYHKNRQDTSTPPGASPCCL